MLTLLLTLSVVMAAGFGIASASQNFTMGSAANVEIGQQSTNQAVTFAINLADGESSNVQIETAALPAGASLSSIQGVTTNNGNVTAGIVSVTGSVAEVSVSDTSAGGFDPASATVTVTLELDTSGLTSESTNVQYDLTEVGGSTVSGTFDLVDTTAPTYDSAVTGDLPGGDSTANDRVTLILTEAGTGIDPSTVSTGDFSVDGSAPATASVTTAGGQQVIQLTVGTQLATDATPTVDLTGTIADNASNTLSGPVSKTAGDGLVPVISSATYNDTDEDGQVDRLNVTYSEAIAGGYTDGDWSIPTTGTVSLAKDGTGAVSSPSVLLDVTGAADTTGGSTAPGVSYSGTSITDASGNANAAGAETVTVTDIAVPVNVSVEAKDANGDDQVDRIDVGYSEDISTSTPETGDYALGGTDAGSVSITGSGVSGSVVQLSVSAPAGNTNLDLTLDYDANAGSAESVTDGSNPAPSFTGAPVTDTTPPSIDAATVLDRDGDGSIDAVNVTFSEAVNDSSVIPSDFTISGNATDALDTLGAADDDTIQLRITTAASEVDGTDAKDLEYSPGSTTDLAGNALAAVAAGDVTETDGATPVVSNFAFNAGAGGEVVATFNVTETLASGTVDVTGADTGSITSFTTSGPIHRGSLSVSQNGQYTGTLTAASDGAGNAAMTLQSDTATVDSISTSSASSSPRVLSGVSSRKSLTTETGLVEVGALFEGARASTIEVHEIDRPADGRPGTFVAGVDIAVSAGFEDISATVKFAITRDRLASLGINPAELTVYRYHDGGWQSLKTSAQVGHEYVTVVAETPGFSLFVITDGSNPERQTSGDVQESSDERSTSSGASMNTDATTSSGSGEDGSESGDRTETDGMPGFTGIGALIALTAVIGILARRM